MILTMRKMASELFYLFPLSESPFFLRLLRMEPPPPSPGRGNVLQKAWQEWQ